MSRLAAIPLMAFGLASAVVARPAVGQRSGNTGPDSPEVKKAIARVKRLAKLYLPTPQDLASLGDWKLPWQLPENVQLRVDVRTAPKHMSEEAYWASVVAMGRMLGAPEAEAREHLEKVLEMSLKQGRDEGMTRRHALIMVSMRFRRYTALTLADLWQHYTAVSMGVSTMLRDAIQAQSQGRPVDRSGGDKKLMRAKLMEAKLLRAVMAPWDGVSEGEIQQALLREMTIVQRHTQVVFLRCNDWAGLIKAIRTRDEESESKRFELGIFTVRLRVVDPRRLAEIIDLTPERIPPLQAKMTALVDLFRKAGQLVGNKELAKLRERLARARAREEPQPELIAYLRKEIEGAQRVIASVARVALVIEPKQFGDNSYVIRMNIPVELPAMSMDMSTHTAYIRNGAALVDIQVAGNLPAPEVARTIEHFLRVMEERTRPFRVAGR